MSKLISPHEYKEIEIRQLRLGDVIINLGEVLEIDELADFFSIVISRQNKKEVFEFWKGTVLLIRHLDSSTESPTLFMSFVPRLDHG